MLGFKKKKDAQINVLLEIERQLACIPLHNIHVSTDYRQESKILVIEVELKFGRTPAFLRKFLKLKKTQKYQIDGISLALYNLMDGVKTVGDLVEWISREYNLKFFEARGMVIHYLHLLTQKGLIAVALTKEPSD